MALLDDVASYLVTVGVGGFPGTTGATGTGWTIFKGFSPPSPHRQITLYETGGFAPEEMTDLDRPGFQVVVRGSRDIDVAAAYSSARTKLDSIFTTLHGLATQTINSRYYPVMFAQGDALSLGKDENDRPMLAQNYFAVRSRTT